MVEIRAYVTKDEKAPYGEWFASLDPHVAVRVQQALLRMELGNFGDTKTVGGGGTKRRQPRDIDKAKRLWAEYKARKRKGD